MHALYRKVGRSLSQRKATRYHHHHMICRRRRGSCQVAGERISIGNLIGKATGCWQTGGRPLGLGAYCGGGPKLRLQFARSLRSHGSPQGLLPRAYAARSCAESCARTAT